MMYISFIHENGKTYQIPVSQVVVYAEDGQPCAVTYEHAGLIVHSNGSMDDFANLCAQLKIRAIKPEEIDA